TCASFHRCSRAVAFALKLTMLPTPKPARARGARISAAIVVRISAVTLVIRASADGGYVKLRWIGRNGTNVPSAIGGGPLEPAPPPPRSAAALDGSPAPRL